MDALAAIDAARVVPVMARRSSAWPQALDGERRYFEVLARRHPQGDRRRAARLAEAVKTAGRSERGNWALFDDYNERNATAAYAELEWE